MVCPFPLKEAVNGSSTRTDQATEWIDFSIPIKVSASFSTIQSLISQDMLELPEKNSTRETMSALFKSSVQTDIPRSGPNPF